MTGLLPIGAPDRTGVGSGRRRRPGRRVVAGLVAVLVVIAVVAGTYLVDAATGTRTTDAGAAPAAPAKAPTTAPVVRKTLRNQVRVDASVVHPAAGTVTTGRAGTLTWLPPRGTVLTRGKVAFRVDDEPVLVLLGVLPAYRDLRPGDEGSDVRQLQLNLRWLGYGGFAVDGTYTNGTRDAVKRWLKAHGTTGDGSLPRGHVVVLPGERRAGAGLVDVGRQLLQGDQVLKLQQPVGRLQATLPKQYASLARRGAAVRVLAGGRKVGTGTVVGVTKVTTTDGATGYRLRISTTAPARVPSGSRLVVVLTKDEAKDVLTVPVTALLSVPEGYAVDVYDAGRTRRVVVEVGLFTNDEVEVRSPALTEGMTVTVPEV